MVRLRFCRDGASVQSKTAAWSMQSDEDESPDALSALGLLQASSLRMHGRISFAVLGEAPSHVPPIWVRFVSSSLCEALGTASFCVWIVCVKE